MEKQKLLKRAAAAVSGVLVISGTTGMKTADSTDTGETTAVTATAEDTTAADKTEASSAAGAETAEDEQQMPEDWVKADISEYDSSLSLISYELATPEMAKVGEPADPFKGLSEEERKALEEEIA